MQLSDKKYAKRLKDFGIKLVTTYKSGDNLVEKSSDSTLKSDIVNGIRLEKNYLRGGKSIFKLVNFDPRIKYTFVGASNADICPNCGAKINVESGECPYCGTSYNMDYDSKTLGAKYHTDLVMHSNLYKKITLLVDVIVCFIISFVYFKTTGRTFNGWDLTKVFGLTMLLSLIFYYFFYYMDSFFVLLPIKIYKEKINAQQEKFWNENKSKINKNTFFTNLNYELQKFYFEGATTKNVLDFDFVDYTTISKTENGDKKIVDIQVLVREVYVDGGKIKCRQNSKNIKLQYVKREFLLEKVGGVALRCKNCGSSIDAFNTTCSSCGTRQNYLQEWYMI